MFKNNRSNKSLKLTDFERMINGHFYNPLDKTLIFKRTKARWLADKYNRTKSWNTFLRKYIIKKLMPYHGTNFFFEPTIHVEYGENITFGDNFYMNFDCILLDVAPITIGNDVMFGPRVIVATPMHPFLPQERITQQYPDGFHDLEYAKPVKIGNNVWVASNATICGGVSIGDNSIIAAGSIVTRDIPANVIAAGSPCKPLRKLNDDDKLLPLETYNINNAPISLNDTAKIKNMS